MDAARPPALVDPGPELDAAGTDRYSRHLLLPELGADGQRRLAAARVLLIGVGGLGSPALQYLAAAGVGTIGLVDDDTVEESNLQRQVVHGTADAGRAKVDSGAEAVRRLNPLVSVRRHRERLDAANAVELLSGYDLVVDGSDNFATRYLVNDACVLTGTPWVWGAVLRFEGQVSLFWPGRGPQYRDLFPAPPAAGTVPSCSEAGVLGAVCGVVGSIMATEAIKVITGTGGTLLGRVLVLDALTWRIRTLGLRPDPDRPPVTDLTEHAVADQAPLPSLTAGELAGRLRAAPRGFTLVDVRDDEERATGTIPGAVPVPLARIATADLPPGPLVLYCAGGTRSAQGVRVLQERGFPDVSHLEGGIRAWRAGGH
jgi:molybdopterin/thiamine biosynthesis adenylyltransferase/rhodanese-related sulfurtransferase